MARAIVLTFEDNAEAEDFIEVFNRSRRQERFEGKGAQLELMVAIPTVFCEHSGSGGCRPSGKKYGGWARGKKWGWWCCAICGKPSGHPSPMKRLRSCLGQARNLLEEKTTEVSEVSDEGWGASGR